MAVIAGETEARGEGDDLVLWILVWSELAAFGILLAGFLVMSLMHPESFSAAKLHLDARLASLNTLVLIASGWLARFYEPMGPTMFWMLHVLVALAGSLSILVLRRMFVRVLELETKTATA